MVDSLRHHKSTMDAFSQLMSGATSKSKASPTTIKSAPKKSLKQKYFHEVLTVNVKGGMTYKCDLCSKSVVCSASTDYNLKRHMKAYHEKEYDDWEKEGKKSLAQEGSKSRIVLNLQERADIAITKMILLDAMPLNTVRKEGFREYTETLSSGKYKLPSFERLRDTMIPNYYTKVKNATNELIEKSDFFACCVDGWSDSQSRSYLGVTLHLISEWEPKVIHLAVREFSGPHTASNILNIFNDVCEEWGLEMNKMTQLIIDGARNMIKFGRELEEECEQVHMERELDEEPMDQELELGEMIDFDVTNVVHHICVVHGLQRVVVDGLKKCDSARSVMKKASTLVNAIKHSSNDVTHVKQTSGKSIIVSCPTRWSGDHDMIQRLIEIKKSSPTALSGTSAWENKRLSAADFKTLSVLQSSLMPLKEATDLLQGDNTTMGLVIPVLQGIKDTLEKLQEESSSEFRGELLASLEKRYPNGGIKNYALRLAKIVDPRFGVTSKEDADILRHEIEKLASVDDVIVELPTEPDASTIKEIKPHSSLYELITNKAASSRPKFSHSEEVESFIELPPTSKVNPYQWWKTNESNYPKIAKLAKKYLTAPPSSAPVERLFSTAGFLCSGRRNRMKPDILQKCLFVKRNNHLLGE